MVTDVTDVSAAGSVVAVLQKASAATGSDFSYLLNTAMRESGLKSDAQAASSSASGLFQFVEQTWLGMVKNYGAKYGLGSYANAITEGANGHYTVENAADRQSILNLRQNPEISALMAGEYAGQCKNQMECSLGRSVSDGELYAAHFLGAGGASKLIRMAENAPGAPAANAFPQAAAANRSVFYHADGRAKSASEVYAWATHESGVRESGSHESGGGESGDSRVKPSAAVSVGQLADLTQNGTSASSVSEFSATSNARLRALAAVLLSDGNQSVTGRGNDAGGFASISLSLSYDLLHLLSDDYFLANGKKST